MKDFVKSLFSPPLLVAWVGLIVLAVFPSGRTHGLAFKRPQSEPFAPKAYLPTVLPSVFSLDNGLGEESVRKACKATYSKLYAGGKLEIRVVFGYKDARPARFVGDRYERNTVVSYLLAPCIQDWHACGFSRAENDPDTFRKMVAGPDGGAKEVVLKLVQSSVGPDDQENRNDTFQKVQSALAETTFLEGLKNAQVVLYHGHSRSGGGPDFEPPRLRKLNFVDSKWYEAETPGLKSLTTALAAGEPAVQLLGLYSCISQGHFARSLAAAKPNLATITNSELLFYTDAMKQLLGTVSGLVGKWCAPSLEQLLTADSSGGTTLQGLFEKID